MVEVEIGQRLFWALLIIALIIFAERLINSFKFLKLEMSDRIDHILHKFKK